MIRNGQDYRESIRDGREVYINGERVTDVPTHPMFKPLVDIRARIYDMAHEDATKDLMTYEDLLPAPSGASGCARAGGGGDGEGTPGSCGSGGGGFSPWCGDGGPDLRGPGELPSPRGRACHAGWLDPLRGVGPGAVRGRASGRGAVPPQGAGAAAASGTAERGADRASAVVAAKRLLRPQPGLRASWGRARFRSVGPVHDALAGEPEASVLHPRRKEVLYMRKGRHDAPEPAEDERIDAEEFVARVLVQIPDPRSISYATTGPTRTGYGGSAG